MLWSDATPAVPLRQSQVALPSQCIGWGDAGSVTTASVRQNPDNWVPDVAYDAAMNQFWGGGATYFRDPSARPGRVVTPCRFPAIVIGRTFCSWTATTEP